MTVMVVVIALGFGEVALLDGNEGFLISLILNCLLLACLFLFYLFYFY